MSLSDKREAKLGFAFISPWLVGFSIFYLIPMIAALVISFTDLNLATPDEVAFNGVDNWKRMLFDDPNTWKSLWITLRFGLISLPFGMASAFLLAVLLNSLNLVGRNIFRTLFFAPSLVPFVAGALIWSQVLNAQTGWVNRIIEWFGIPAVGLDGIRWLDEPGLIPVTFTFIGIWGIGNAILINLAGLQGIPTALHEAAQIDGAGYWRRLRSISLPMVTPVIFYNLVLGVVGLLQYFLPPFVLNGTTGYPEGATNFFMIYFYQQAFDFSQMGYGAALAWLLFFFGLAFTVFLFGTQKYWVYYAAGD
ncbi:MAG: sugar ABC transporter permease [Acidimicrobiia bacterium]|nr:sugar ABC transporter permease [Acidimicrobiia bacterium]